MPMAIFMLIFEFTAIWVDGIRIALPRYIDMHSTSKTTGQIICQKAS